MRCPRQFAFMPANGEPAAFRLGVGKLVLTIANNNDCSDRHRSGTRRRRFARA